jgi:hypothetical protein
MTKLALLIGINYIGQNSELNGCINDIMNIKQILMSKMGFKKRNIIVLSDRSAIKPTTKNILRYLRLLTYRSNQGFGELFLHYSGHGSYVQDYSGDEWDGRDEVIVPVDYKTAGVISDDMIFAILRRINKKTKLTCIMDCCHSGTILDLPFQMVYYKRRNRWARVNRNVCGANICMISGCRDYQTSADAKIKEKRTEIWQGAMTWSLLQTLKKTNYKISINHLINSMRVLLKKSRYTQIPQMTSTKLININSPFLNYTTPIKIISVAEKRRRRIRRRQRIRRRIRRRNKK